MSHLGWTDQWLLHVSCCDWRESFAERNRFEMQACLWE